MDKGSKNAPAYCTSGKITAVKVLYLEVFEVIVDVPFGALIVCCHYSYQNHRHWIN